MMKPDFKQMPRKELKKYLLAHPGDDEALRELVLNRKNPNAKRYPANYEISQDEIEAILKHKD